MARTVESKVIVTDLYPSVKKTLAKKEVQQEFKNNLDRYMSKNVECFSGAGPTTKPIFGKENETKLVNLVGLTDEQIKAVLKTMKGNDPAWKNFNTPFNIAIVLALRFFEEAKNAAQITNGLMYLTVHIYAYKFTVYFQFEPNPSAMAYTVSEMSNRFKLKKCNTLLATLMDTAQICYNTHKDRLMSGQDIAALKFVNDMTTRINSLLKVICREYMATIKEGRYLQTEHESFDDEDYYEADSDSYAIDRVANKVLTNLIVNGPDRRLVELAAQNSSVSINTLHTCVLVIISEDNKEELRRMIECLLSLYLRNNPNKSASIRDIGTNKFYMYCMEVYRSSNTTNRDIIEIKEILNGWVNQPDIKRKVETKNSIGLYRKAIYTFFVFTIEKLS